MVEGNGKESVSDSGRRMLAANFGRLEDERKRDRAVARRTVKSVLMQWRKWSLGLRIGGQRRPASAKKSAACAAGPK